MFPFPRAVCDRLEVMGPGDCAHEAPEGSRFCPACGIDLSAQSALPTRITSSNPPGPSERARARGPGRGPSIPSRSSPFDQGRFLPGTVLAGRYRIYGLLGRGGMGEVYRADDLKLGQTVALKFLPKAVERDEARLSRFLNEVKIARQISHTNVCRVYDVGEVEGHHFISMEFVDGEDLAALLRRIDRLPRDKAIQIARQLCAGLAAAHEQGVLHRDLKPANVMIDGRGRARITDFGLAELAAHVADADSGAGTPAYMAPEQLAGKSASIKSDLYSLGLVFYELFTGRRAFSAATPEELVRIQQETTPTSPSSHVEGFDPAVERVILRCLQKHPGDRPGSALSVAAALPGGDPLAAALAAGETPSPELVAEAGEVGGLSQAAAWVCLSALLVGTLLVILLSGRTQIVRIVPLTKPPAVLAEKARVIARELGYSAPPGDTALGFYTDDDYLRYVSEHDLGVRRWERLSKASPPAVVFWYRESPTDLYSKNPLQSATLYHDPPALVAGMVGVLLDPEGRLQGFEAVPPERDDSTKTDAAVDWSIPLKEAGFDPAALETSEPRWAPATFGDQRVAWEGTYPEAPEFPVRIEAAAYRGRPVAFRIIHPWTEPSGAQAVATSLLARLSQVLATILIVAILIGGVLVARKNLRLGRGDRKGARRLAVFVLSLGWAGTVLHAHHVASFGEVPLIIVSFCVPLLLSSAIWIFYLALEPNLRRLWPQTIVSWVRLLDGRFRDPLVGRDVVVGLLAGLALRLLDQVYQIVPGWLGLPPPIPDQVGAPMDLKLGNLKGLRHSVAFLVENPIASLVIPLGLVVLLLLCRLVFRKPWLAIAAFMVLTTIPGIPTGASPLVSLIYSGLCSVVFLIVLFRFGLLPTFVSYIVAGVLTAYPMTTDASAWYAGYTLLALLVVAGIAAYGFRVALPGRALQAALPERLRS